MIKLSVILAFALLLLASPSPAHESWISKEGAINPVTGKWCCGARDCGIVMPAPIATAAGEILGLHGRLRVHKSCLTLRSPDGHFYRCHTVGRDYDEDSDPNG